MQVNHPSPGTMYRCKKCGLEMQVTQDCDPDVDCESLTCCGEPLTDITEPTIQESKLADETDKSDN